MQTEEASYAHGPVDGLPKSLVKSKEGEAAVIVLMRSKAGLNRKRVRELRAKFKPKNDRAEALTKSMFADDWQLLVRYVSADHRWGNFWSCMQSQQQKQIIVGSVHFTLALDIQLLNAYDPSWMNLEEDAETLTGCCPEWPRIREALLKYWKGGKTPMHLGVFMLWPQLQTDLQKWSSLDAARQLEVAHAVFSLSSVGWTRWFIDQALAICPSLEEELGEAALPKLTKPNSTGNSATSTSAVDTCGEMLGLSDPSEKQQSHLEQWSDIGYALKTLEHDWGTELSRELLEKLIALCSRASQLLNEIPEIKISPREILEQRLTALDVRLKDSSQAAEFRWLGDDELKNVLARWWLAAAQAEGDGELESLASDADNAQKRLDSAFEAMQAAVAAAIEAKRRVLELDEQYAGHIPLAQRIEVAQCLDQAREKQRQAELLQRDAMLSVLAAASPNGEAFNPGANYVAAMAALASRGEQVVAPLAETVLGEPAIDEGQGHSVQTEDRVVPDEVTYENAAAKVDESRIRRNSSAPALVDSASNDTVTDACNLASQLMCETDVYHEVKDEGYESAVDGDGSAQHQLDESTERQAAFTDEVGDQCRPIWTLLRMGKASLAYQFANTLQTDSPDLRVPPPKLLRSVALTRGLTASDGPLAMAIGDAFLEIDSTWFEPGKTPSKWHTALNLLLIAATLRPMILAPATGASSVARYRHLDGRHSELLELVRKVGELSEPLTGFAIGPTVLGSAADEASQREHLKQLSKDAEDWLYERAPRKKFRYAPASKVWLHWLKPGEFIHRLISLVVLGAMEQRSSVRSLIDELSDYDVFLERVRDTDRRQLQRRGQDIEAGALEHLWVATCEAVTLAKGWLAAAMLFSESGSRLRVLVGQLKAAFDTHAPRVIEELEMTWEGDGWGQVTAASLILSSEVTAIVGMLKQSDAVMVAEPQPKEILARELLLVPLATVDQSWNVESDGIELLQALEDWSNQPVAASSAFDTRVRDGDLAGAEQLLPLLPDDTQARLASIDRARDLWTKDLHREIQQARRASEVGLAFGYLSDEERSSCESELSAVELGQKDSRRFDVALKRIRTVTGRIERQKTKRVDEARLQFDQERPGLNEDVAQELAAPLERSDIHTFNELLQRVRQGSAPWPEKDQRRDLFREFYPTLHTEVLNNLAKTDPTVVDKLIRNGGALGTLSFDLDGDDAARSDAEEIYSIWATAFSRRTLGRDNLKKVLEALGLSVRSLDQDNSGMGWTLVTTPIDDREVCPVPHFGSRAQGRYRVVVFKDRLSPEDLLQRIGDSTQQTATIVISLTRSPQRFWPDLARLSKERQRSFLLLDESILLTLLAQRGSRLASWFSIALPLTYSEPYDASAGFVPPEMFYGRTSELEGVKAQGRCYFIYGGRQLGKTALLRRAEKTFHEPGADRYAVWVDLLALGIGERRPASDVWLSFSDKLRELNLPGLDLPPVNPGKQTSIDGFLAALKAFIQAKPGRRILLLLDEADHFFEQDGRQESAYAETRRLKQLMDETERRFKVVFAGLHNVLRTVTTSNQPLGHLNEAVRIGPLMDEREIRAAESLITQPIEAAGYEFEDRSLVMRVLAQTNYYPSLIQLYCTQLLRHMRETKLRRRDVAGPRFKIDETDIESVFSGRPLREAIRSKFRLTLQLDDRYEVIAYAIGLEALDPGFDHAQGIDWREIWRDCANSWWPEGFATTSERDFLGLLEEMVELGVLSPAKSPEHFSLRNPNVLLLLGNKQEIENTLSAEREPRIEFESTIFRPALGRRVDDPARNPLTYRQLDEVVQTRNSVLLVAASEAAGGANLLAGLRDQPGMAGTGRFVQLDRSSTRSSFMQELDKEVKNRVSDGITVMFVPAKVPWDAEWVIAARAKLKALKSASSFVSVAFAADPQRLWALAAPVPEQATWIEPWLSVLPWSRGFIRKWLEELQLPVDSVDRLQELTGGWGGLLESVAKVKGGGLVDFVPTLDRMIQELDQPETRRQNQRRLSGGVEEGELVLKAMLSLGDHVSESDLVEFGELPHETVRRALLWAEPLGLISRQAGSVWAMDPFVKRVFQGSHG